MVFALDEEASPGSPRERRDGNGQTDYLHRGYPARAQYDDALSDRLGTALKETLVLTRETHLLQDGFNLRRLGNVKVWSSVSKL